MRPLQSGFTLIELMIAVSIVGMLAAIAVPAYLNYSIRSEVAEGLSLSGNAKSAVAGFYQNFGKFPADNNEAGISAADEIKGDFVSSVTIAENVVSVLYGNEANSRIAGRKIELVADTTSVGSIVWSCSGAADMQNKYLPSACE